MSQLSSYFQADLELVLIKKKKSQLNLWYYLEKACSKTSVSLAHSTLFFFPLKKDKKLTKNYY